MSGGAYARAGVDTGQAGQAVSALVGVLSRIDTGRPSRSVVPSGHYASVVRLDDGTGIALTTDGVGSKVIVAEHLGRFDTIGIDCVAMNVNDLVCVGAEPFAMLDYLAVEEAEPEMLRQVAEGLRTGAEQAGIEIPGGELAQLPELIRGHPSPHGFDLVGACFGVVGLDRLVLGDRVAPGDAVIGVPSSGVHSNGLTLARRVLDDLAERPPELEGASVAETLLEPTTIYVRAALDLLADPDIDVRGLAHITGDGLLNLLRLGAEVGYRIDAPPDPHPIFELVRDRLAEEHRPELWEVFNMGCGFGVVVPAEHADATAVRLADRHPGARRIGEVTDSAGLVELPEEGLVGRPGEGFGRA